jgi:methionyl-tRNA formyltransferase
LAGRPKAVFFGTPRFSVPALEAVALIADIPLVVSQPDKETGRGRKVFPTPVKEAAGKMGIPVLQPEKLKDPKLLSALRDAGADFFFTAAYGKIIPQSILDIPRLGCLNLHASLLPRYRGSAPIQWAVLKGEKVTGLTLMLMDRGMDTGPMLEKMEIEIHPGETAGELSERMSLLAPAFIAGALPKFLDGRLAPQTQDESRATCALMLRKEDGRIDWRRPAREVACHILGMNPWPMAFTTAAGTRVRILRAEEVKEIPESCRSGAAPGRVLCDGSSMLVVCGYGAVRILELQAEGRKAMEASCFICGTPPPETFE